MRYTTRKSVIQVIGTIWMPSVTAAMTYDLDSHDLGIIRDEDTGQITREGVQYWLDTRAGDFQNVTDYFASIEDGPNTIEFAWSDEESEFTFSDCMYGSEEM